MKGQWNLLRVAWLVLMLAWLLSIYAWQRMFETQTALGGKTPMCMSETIRVHEAGKPTGYIIGEVEQGQQVWVQDVVAPFATITYLHEGQWLDGTVPANLLALCEEVEK